MIEAVNNLSPAEREMSEAFFNWQERGFSSAWASLADAKQQTVPRLIALLGEYRRSEGVDTNGHTRENHMACSAGLSDAIWGKPYDRRCDLCKRTDAVLEAAAK